ncbi:ArnT family glycosyltransferase [Elusimicrobiota bacterium]
MRRFLPLILLLIFCTISISSLIRKSPTYDEVQHISSGFLTLKTGNYNIGYGHPFLFRAIAAFPLLFMDLSYPADNYLSKIDWGDNPKRWIQDYDYSFGNDFIYRSGNDPEAIFMSGRITAVLFAALLGFLVYYFSQRLYDTSGALFSLFLYVFSPTIIAHSRLIMNDLPGALGIVLTIYTLSCYLKNKSIPNLILLALSFTFSLLLKFSAVVLVPFIFLIMCLDHKENRWLSILAAALVFTLAVFLTINTAYGFNGTFSDKLISYDFIMGLTKNKTIGYIMFNLYRKIPLPESFMRSFVTLIVHNMRGHSSFFAGNYSVFGWWYFFPTVFLLKTPLITIVMLMEMIYAKFRKISLNKDEKMILMFIILYMIVSMNSSINIGQRHLLPIYPLIFILMGSLSDRIIKKKFLRIAIPVLYILSTQIYFPHYLSFFNILTGGSSQGYRYLADSNLDWGQDLKGLKKFILENNNPAVILSYFGTVPIKHYDMNCQELFHYGVGAEESGYVNPVEVEKEYFAISVTNLQSVYFRDKDFFKWIRKKKPFRKIGYSIFVYDITEDEESTAILGEIYRALRKTEYAKRQYYRLKYITKDMSIKKWADEILLKI